MYNTINIYIKHVHYEHNKYPRWFMKSFWTILYTFFILSPILLPLYCCLEFFCIGTPTHPRLKQHASKANCRQRWFPRVITGDSWIVVISESFFSNFPEFLHFSATCWLNTLGASGPVLWRKVVPGRRVTLHCVPRQGRTTFPHINMPFGNAQSYCLANYMWWARRSLFVRGLVCGYTRGSEDRVLHSFTAVKVWWCSVGRTGLSDDIELLIPAWTPAVQQLWNWGLNFPGAKTKK